METTVLPAKNKAPARYFKIGFISFIILILILMLLIFSLNRFVNDHSVPIVDTLIAEGDPNRLMVIFPHPDDEVTIAGSLYNLNQQFEDMEITLVYLTRGEAGPTGGLVTQDELGAKRSEEIREVARILEVENLELFDFPDSGLIDTDKELIKDTILNMINQYQPSTIITFDDIIGLYGHIDHKLTGEYVREVVVENMTNEEFPVNRLYFTTLPQPMIDVALQISETFKNQYPSDPEEGLPVPTAAIKMTDAAREKNAVIRAHETQLEILGDVQPLYHIIPPRIYYTIFDREYYALVEER